MDRDEILARSRLENRDEGLLAAEHRGRKLGYTAFLAVLAVLGVVDFCRGQPIWGYLALTSVFTAAEAFSSYRFTGKRNHLFFMILGTLATLLALAAHIGVSL